MITILYPYRDRELSRIKRSFVSLSEQSNKNFNVLFVDYGSKPELYNSVKELLSSYGFVKHIYSYHCNQPWSRAKAINIGLKQVETKYVFVADIDMIFRVDFVEKLNQFKKSNNAIYFKVGFLDKKESNLEKLYFDYKVSYYSQPGAQGLSLFPIEMLKKVNGFDEFFHFWGAEDEDIHNRLKKAGYESVFYNDEILMLHQWHASYRVSETKGLNQYLQLANISRINQEHLYENEKSGCTIVNHNQWGRIISKAEFDFLDNGCSSIVIENRKEVVDYFLYVKLASHRKGVLNVVFQIDNFQNSLKYVLKKVLGKTVPSYYTLKEINDVVLLHLISFYRDCNYSFVVSSDLKSLHLKIKKD
jgi:hypothetical protein